MQQITFPLKKQTEQATAKKKSPVHGRVKEHGMCDLNIQK